MSTKLQSTMIKFFRILFCILCVLLIALVEDPELVSELREKARNTLYIYMILAFAAVFFLQNQLYNYLLPKNLRNQPSNIQNHKVICTLVLPLSF